MLKMFKAACCVALLVVAGTSVNAAQTWRIGTVDYCFRYGGGVTYTGWFEFSNGVLDVKGCSGSLQPWNGAKEQITTFGTWAVCGTISNNQLVRDPYATFVATSKCTGYISWADNTPENYLAPLMLGAKFEGFGGQKPGTDLKEATSIVWQYFLSDSYNGGWIQVDKDPGSHTFWASQSGAVPEPASILTLLAGVGSVAGVAVRRRR